MGLRLGGRKQLIGLAAGVLALLLIVAGLVGWLTSRTRPEQPAAGTETTQPGAPSTPARPVPSQSEAQARLLQLLPAGYPPNACRPAAALAGAIAEVSCGANTDRGGPTSATYTLFPNEGPMRLSFDTLAQSSTVVDCPGRIQSPGPWHRAATPNKPTGTLLCAIRQNRATVAWTDDADLLVNVVQADHGAAGLDQLYAWWRFHS